MRKKRRRKKLTKMKRFRSLISGATASAMNMISRDLKTEIDADELEAMGKGVEEHEEGGDDHGEE